MTKREIALTIALVLFIVGMAWINARIPATPCSGTLDPVIRHGC